MALPPPKDDAWILAQRGPRNPVRADRPYAWLVEPERTADGGVVDVATIFLANRECPFRCLMCDLWKNTLTESVEVGAIPTQIRWALDQLPRAQHLKLYNSGNFFDPGAIPPDDYHAIAELTAPFERVIVECHPRLIGKRCLEFQRMLSSEFEVAMGLETAHPEVLARLNKQMTLDDFARGVEKLRRQEIACRAFILVRPPFLSEEAGLEWACRSLDFAFGVGVQCCSLIPTRAGNGAMEELARHDLFAPPSLDAVERAFEYGLSLGKGRVFVDLWDIDKLAGADPDRIARLQRMNLEQTIIPRIPT